MSVFIQRDLDNGYKIAVELKYRQGGNNPWSGEEIERGYVLSFSFYKETKEEDGTVTEIIEPRDPRNFTLMIEPAKRFSQKKFNNFCEAMDKNKEKMLDLYEDIANNKEFRTDKFLGFFKK